VGGRLRNRPILDRRSGLQPYPKNQGPAELLKGVGSSPRLPTKKKRKTILVRNWKRGQAVFRKREKRIDR